MDWAQYYAQLSEMARAGQELGFFDNFFRLFYQAFIEGSRWQLYLRGLAVTLQLTVIALCIGIVLGVLVAVVRTAHDQQRLGRRSIFLSFCNVLCQIYTTDIRGTPMMVQLLIWGFVIFSSSRNKTMVGALGIGINSGAYVA